MWNYFLVQRRMDLTDGGSWKSGPDTVRNLTNDSPGKGGEGDKTRRDETTHNSVLSFVL